MITFWDRPRACDAAMSTAALKRRMWNPTPSFAREKVGGAGVRSPGAPSPATAFTTAERAEPIWKKPAHKANATKLSDAWWRLP